MVTSDNNSQEYDSDCPDDVFISTFSSEIENEGISEQPKKKRGNSWISQMFGITHLNVLIMVLWLSKHLDGHCMLDKSAENSKVCWEKNDGVLSMDLFQVNHRWNNNIFVYAVPSQTYPPIIRIRHRQENLVSNSSTLYNRQASSSEEHLTRGQMPETEGPPTATRANMPDTRRQPILSRVDAPEAGGPTETRVNLPVTREQPMAIRGWAPFSSRHSTTLRGHGIQSAWQPRRLRSPQARRQLPVVRAQESALNRQSADMGAHQVATITQVSARRREPARMPDQPSNIFGYSASQNVPSQQIYPHMMRFLIEEFDGSPVIRVDLNADFLNNYHRYGGICVISEPATGEMTRHQSPRRGQRSDTRRRSCSNRNVRLPREQPSDIPYQRRSNGRGQPLRTWEQPFHRAGQSQPSALRRQYSEIGTSDQSIRRSPAGLRQRTCDVTEQHFDADRGENAQRIYPYVMSYRIEQSNGVEVIRVLYTPHFLNNRYSYGIICVTQSQEPTDTGEDNSEEN